MTTLYVWVTDTNTSGNTLDVWYATSLNGLGRMDNPIQKILGITSPTTSNDLRALFNLSFAPTILSMVFASSATNNGQFSGINSISVAGGSRNPVSNPFNTINFNSIPEVITLNPTTEPLPWTFIVTFDP
jgi:hypothetical protein